MDKIAKFLLVCDAKQTQILLDIIQKIQNLNFEGLDIKKIQWKKDFYRVRTWKLRVIFYFRGKEVFIDNIGYRWQIYKNIK